MLENGQMATLNMKDILPNRFQPRIRFDEVKLNELAESIRKYGLIQPIVVRKIGTKYEIIAGERRFKASSLANKETIPAIIVNLSDRDSEEIALLENVQREDLTPIEEAVSYKRILDVGYITQEELAKKIGKSQSSIANKIRLLNLDDIVQDALLHGKISERHARSLLKIHSNEKQVNMLNRIINERLTVKMTDQAIKEILNSEENEEKSLNKDSNEKKIETLSTDDKPIRRAVPVASHRIIKVNPPKELEEKTRKEREKETMDIDKILEEAQDINQEQPVKQANDMEALMKQNPNTETSPIIKSEPEVQEETPAIEPGKFVTPLPEMPVIEKEEPTASVSFDSIFGQAPTIKEEPQPVVSNQVQENASMPLDNISPTPDEATVVNNQPMNIGPSLGDETQNIPVVNNLEPSLENKLAEPQPVVTSLENSTLESVTPEVNNKQNVNAAPIMDNNPAIVQPNINPFETTEQIITPEVNITNTPEFNNAQSNETKNINVEPVMPMANPTMEVSPAAQTFPQPLNPVQVEPVTVEPIDNNLETVVTPMSQPLENIPSNIPDDTIVETTNQQPINPVVNDGVKFRQVINLIRGCASEIEKLGYFIDVDEIDLSNKYQVTFRINKDWFSVFFLYFKSLFSLFINDRILNKWVW